MHCIIVFNDIFIVFINQGLRGSKQKKTKTVYYGIIFIYLFFIFFYFGTLIIPKYSKLCDRFFDFQGTRYSVSVSNANKCLYC